MTREDAKREMLFAKRNVMKDSFIDQAYDVAIKALEQPERKKGKWIETADGTMCSNCHKFPYDDGEYHIANWYSDFCPNCGADMRGEQDE